MSHERRARERRVKELLLSGDPAAHDAGLGTDERTRMRANLARETGAAPSGHRRVWQPAFALGTAALAATVLWFWLAPSRPSSMSPSLASAKAPAAQPAAGRRRVPEPTSPTGDAQQIQFVTKGGTRVIWLLNPRFTH
jgi:hypothetical protein